MKRARLCGNFGIKFRKERKTINKKKKQAFEKIKSILKHGDIIITQDKGWKAKIIGKVCKTGGLGIWNHAMIVIYHPKATHPTDEDLVIMEALSEGVSLTPIDKAFKRCKYWEIERVNPGYVTSKDYIQTIAMRYHCVPYAWAQLFGDIFLLWLRGISGKRAYKMLFRSGLNTSQAIERIKEEVAQCDEVQCLISFIEGAKRGVTK